MARKASGPSGHTGQTSSGNVKDVKVDRIGPVTIYKRGLSYFLYFREAGKSCRRKVDGNLAVARVTATQVAAALAQNRPAPFGHERTAPDQMVGEYLRTITEVRKLAIRTQDRYRAALERFVEYCRDAGIVTLDSVTEATVEDFVRWLRGQTRTRNGARKGKREVYRTGGIRFILSTCCTAFNWAGRRRMLPPYADNPFARFPIEQLRDRDEADTQARLFTPVQEKAFFEACDAWQRGIFDMLATYGLRVGELTHLLVDDVDFKAGTITIRSKPELLWSVKTGRQRTLPLIPRTRSLLEQAIGDRKAGFVFLNEPYVRGRTQPAQVFNTSDAFRNHLRRLVSKLLQAKPDADERARRKAVTAFARTMGQLPEKRVRDEFLKLTQAIGCPEFTRVHDLRHLFSSRAQEAGLNPLLVQELLGHASLEMTRRYTHLGLEAKREALSRLESTADVPLTTDPADTD